MEETEKGSDGLMGFLFTKNDNVLTTWNTQIREADLCNYACENNKVELVEHGSLVVGKDKRRIFCTLI